MLYRCFLVTALALCIFTPSKTARADDIGAPIVWGLATADVLIPVALVSGFQLEESGVTNAPIYLGLSALALSAGALVLADALELDGRPAAMLHMGFFAGGSMLLLDAIAEGRVSTLGWTLSAIVAAVAAAGGAFADTEEELKAAAASPVGAVLWVCLFALGGFLAVFSADETTRDVAFAAAPALSLASVLMFEALIVGGAYEE